MPLRQALVAGSIGHYQPGTTEHKSMQTEVAEVLIDDGQIDLIRKRQSNADLIAGESIPKGTDR